MKRIIGILFLLVNISQLAIGAAFEPANPEVQLPTCYDDLPKELRLQIINQGLPELMPFLRRAFADCSTTKHRFRPEIPEWNNRDYNMPELGYSFDISGPHNCKLVIIPKPYWLCQPKKLLGEMIIWDMQANKLLHHITHARPFWGVWITRDGKKIIAREGFKEFSIWDVASGKKLYDLGNCDNGLVFNYDGSRVLLIFGGYATIWNTETGEKVNEFFVDYGVSGTHGVAINEDGTKIAVVGSFSYPGIAPGSLRIHVIDVSTGHELFDVHPDNAYQIAGLSFSSDGTRLSATVFCGSSLRGFQWAWDMNGTKLANYESKSGAGSLVVADRYSGQDGSAHFVIYDNDQLIGSIQVYSLDHRAQNSQWLIDSGSRGDEIFATNLEALKRSYNELPEALSSCSGRQILLLTRIQKMAEHNEPLLLSGDEQVMAAMIEDFATLPELIKYCMNSYVAFGAGQ